MKRALVFKKAPPTTLVRYIRDTVKIYMGVSVGRKPIIRFGRWILGRRLGKVDSKDEAEGKG